jgi:hypothetical protein
MGNREYISKWYGSILHIFDFTYRINFYYFKAKNHKEYQAIVRKDFGVDLPTKEPEGSFNVIHHKKHKTDVGCIWVKPTKDFYINLTHECLHATLWAMDKNGMKPCFESEEAYCYYQAFLLREILKLKGGSNER